MEDYQNTGLFKGSVNTDAIAFYPLASAKVEENMLSEKPGNVQTASGSIQLPLQPVRAEGLPDANFISPVYRLQPTLDCPTFEATKPRSLVLRLARRLSLDYARSSLSWRQRSIPRYDLRTRSSA